MSCIYAEVFIYVLESVRFWKCYNNNKKWSLQKMCKFIWNVSLLNSWTFKTWSGNVPTHPKLPLSIRDKVNNTSRIRHYDNENGDISVFYFHINYLFPSWPLIAHYVLSWSVCGQLNLERSKPLYPFYCQSSPFFHIYMRIIYNQIFIAHNSRNNLERTLKDAHMHETIIQIPKN